MTTTTTTSTPQEMATPSSKTSSIINPINNDEDYTDSILPKPIPTPLFPVGPEDRKSRKAINKDESYKKAPKVIPGGSVVYLGRLPHGFYEQELKSFLVQFGEISRLRISRNPRTGASRHFGFVEFKNSEVASIVADTMHNYLLMGRLLQCKVMSAESVHQDIWKGANKKFVHIPWLKMEAIRFNSNNIASKDKSIKNKNENVFNGNLSEALGL